MPDPKDKKKEKIRLCIKPEAEEKSLRKSIFCQH
jgi:hypothetical protein